MVTRKTKAAGLLALGVTAMQCARAPEASGPMPQGEPGLVGRWEWVSSVGGFAGRRTTPAEQGFRVRYTFSAGGTLVVDRTPGDDVTTRWTLREEAAPDGATWSVVGYGTEVNVLPPPVREQFVRRVGRDTLVLSDRCADCFEHTFVRVP